MPDLRKVAALVISDVHWGADKPRARAESDWLGVQLGYLQQVADLQKQAGQCPIIIAGDLFNRWDEPPEAINRLLAAMPPEVHVIAGNHDMPNHNYRELPRSAYWTLVESGKVIHHTPTVVAGTSYGLRNLNIHFFPYSFPIIPPSSTNSLCLNIAIVHDYIWTDKTKIPTAPEEKRYACFWKKLKGYNAAFFGDNHKGFLIPSDRGPTIMNCGTFIRRRIDEVSYQPTVGILYSDGRVARHYLDTSKDQFTETTKKLVELEGTMGVDLTQFAGQMTDMEGDYFDWTQTVHNYATANKLRQEVHNLLIRIIKEARGDRK